MQEAACRAFIALDCAGLARVDFFLGTTRDGADRLVINEVNTMPGFTPISMFPRMWAATGVTYPELVDRLVATRAGRPAPAELPVIPGGRRRWPCWPPSCCAACPLPPGARGTVDRRAAAPRPRRSPRSAAGAGGADRRPRCPPGCRGCPTTS